MTERPPRIKSRGPLERVEAHINKPTASKMKTKRTQVSPKPSLLIASCLSLALLVALLTQAQPKGVNCDPTLKPTAQEGAGLTSTKPTANITHYSSPSTTPASGASAGSSESSTASNASVTTQLPAGNKRELIAYDTAAGSEPAARANQTLAATLAETSSNHTGLPLLLMPTTSAPSARPEAKQAVARHEVATGELTMEPLVSAASSEQQQTGEDLLMATSSSLGQSLAGPLLSSSESTASLMEPEQGAGAHDDELNAAARRGRASQQSVSYSPPATSRLSSYSPTFSLQNSRSHNRQQADQDQANQIGAIPLDLSAVTPPPTTTTTTRRPRPTGPFDPIIVCYLGSWSVYRPSLAKFTPENINPFLCTHIIYAFAGLSSKFELKPFDSYNDITQGGYRKFTSLKDHNKQLKTLIAVGGWNEGSSR